MSAARSSTYDPSARGPDPGDRHSLRGWDAHMALAAALTLLMIAIAAPGASAQQQAWSCDAFGYLFQTQSGAASSEIIQVDLATGVQNPVGVVGTPPPGGSATVNAVGYNSVDNYFYGTMWTVPAAGVGASSVVRIHPDGSVDDLGSPTGPGGTVDPTSNYHIGDVDPNGHYWMSNGVNWYEIDLTTPTPTVLRSGTVTNEPPGIGIADWAWTNGALHSIGNAPAAGTPARLVRFNPTTGVIEDVGPVGFADGGIGAVFVDAAGYLYASQNATNDIYRIDTTTRQTILASEGTGTSPGNDGARCALAPVPTITVTKTVDGRVRADDQFTVALRRPNGSLGDSATTSGSDTTASTVNFPASQGQTYTITDAMAPGSPTPLEEYSVSIACTDADGNPAAVGGTGPSWTLNVAEATGYTCNVTNRATADVVLEKSASPNPVVPGEDVTYSLRVTNNGPATVIGQTVSDDLPDDVTFSSASPGCSEASGTVTCAVADLASGASQTFTITGRVASSLDECLQNSATVSGPTFDPNTSNNSATICTPIEGRADLSMTKTAPATVPAGGQVIYTLVVRNRGPSDDPDVRVSDPLAAGLTLVSADPSQGTCSAAGNAVSCDLGALRDGGSAQVLVTANTTVAGQGITNTARVEGAHEDPDPDNNQDSSTVTVDPAPPAVFDLVVDKQTSATRPRIGQRTTYRIVVRNNGPAPAQNATVTDTFNGRATLVSVRTPQGSCVRRIPITCELGTIPAGESVTITVAIKPRDLGPARNSASATACCGVDATPDNNMDAADVSVRRVSLRVSKVASSSSVQGGETFSYRIRVRNPTRGEARNVRVCDRPGSGLAYVSSKPRARRSGGQRCWRINRLGARQSRSYRVTVRAAPGANGRLTNRATASSPDANTARDRARVRVRGIATPVTG
jgi:uncharacterized repeat protein (TIGR01451 family)